MTSSEVYYTISDIAGVPAKLDLAKKIQEVDHDNMAKQIKTGCVCKGKNKSQLVSWPILILWIFQPLIILHLHAQDVVVSVFGGGIMSSRDKSFAKISSASIHP